MILTAYYGLFIMRKKCQLDCIVECIKDHILIFKNKAPTISFDWNLIKRRMNKGKQIYMKLSLKVVIKKGYMLETPRN